MLKRYQVMMEDWLADYVKQTADKYELSFSEVIRLLVSINLCRLIAKTHFKDAKEFSFNDEDIVDALKNKADGKIDKEEFNKRISKIYFETRKIIEKRLELEDKNPRPKNDSE